MSAVVAADVVDSTAKVVEWETHDRVVRDLIGMHCGREIGRSDGVYALFPDARSALAFASAYHAAGRALSEPINVRIGVHLGHVTVRENHAKDVAQGATPFEVDGQVLPVSVRLMSIAFGGQTLLTRVAADAAGARGIRFISHGHWQLKGIAEPAEVIEAVATDGAPVPPRSTAKAYRVSRVDGAWVPSDQQMPRLPPERGPFVGRGPLLGEIADRMDGGARLISLLGAGGIGKTRLALQYARAWSGARPGGTWFFDLSGSTDTDEMLQAMAMVLDVPLATGDPVATLGAAIAGRGNCLLVLDNLEALAGPAGRLLTNWLDQAPKAAFLVTSRIRLSLPDEQVLAVPPLALDDAARLFEIRSQAAGIRLGPAELEALPALMDMLDRLPLAIELAAARTRVMAPRAMLERTGERLRLLAPARPDPTNRRSTLRAVLDGSWELLSPSEQNTLAQASVFDGGFTLASAEVVLQPVDGPEAPWVADVLQTLIDHSLMFRPATDRFGLLRTVRDYAAERLAAGSQGAATARRHWVMFASLDEDAVVLPGFSDLENLFTACRRAARAGDGPAAVNALTRVAEVLLIRGPLQRLRSLVEAVASLASLNARHRAEVNRVLGNTLYPMGQRDAAMVAYRHGLALARSAGDDDLCIRLCCAIATPLTRSGDMATAQTLLQEALVMADHLGHPVRRCAVLNARGSLAMAEQRLDDALHDFEQAASLARVVGHRRWEGGLLGNLGGVLYLQGRGAAARHQFEASLAIAREVGDRQWAANASCNLGLLQLEAGEHAAAEVSLHAALATAREIGQAPLEATATCNLGLLLLEQDRAAEAQPLLQRAASIAGRLQDPALESQCERGLGRALACGGAADEAVAATERALVLAERAGDSAEQVRACSDLARLQLAKGNATAAAERLSQASRLASSLPPTVRAIMDRELKSLVQELQLNSQR